MRLYNYLNEKVDTKIVQAIQPFLNEFSSAYEDDMSKLIWRGHKGIFSQTMTIKNVHKDRKPRFIPEELHEYLGTVSKKLWGWNIRTEGAFTADRSTAKGFGDAFVFIPIGSYKYVWAKGDTVRAVYSLYDEYGNTKRDGGLDGLYTENEREERLERIAETIEDTYRREYSTTGLSKYLEMYGNPQFECIFNCDKYLMVHTNHWYSFKDRVGLA